MYFFRATFVLIFLSVAAFASPELQFSKGGPHNFGIMMHTKAYTIYRSGALGAEGLKNVAEYLKAKNLPFPKVVIHMNIDGYTRTMLHPTRFAVEEYEERNKYGFEYYHTFRYDYSTYLAGHNLYEAHKNVNKEGYLGDTAKSYFGFKAEQRIEGGMDAFYRVLDLVLESKEPVLIHCTGGHHRTGMIAMAIRYLQGGAWRKGKYNGPNSYGSLNAAQYEYYLHNSAMFRPENVEFIKQWSQDPKFAEYEKRYQARLNERSL